MTFVNIHTIVSVPASCLNRDDTGSPKTLIFGDGGGLRARLSSQSQKRAVKDAIRQGTGGATRLTKEIPSLLAHAISDEPDEKVWETVVQAIGAGLSLTSGKTSENKLADARKAYEEALEAGEVWTLPALYYVNLDDIAALGEALRSPPTDFANGWEEDSDNAATLAAISRLKAGSDPEIAMYGRMVANDPTQNVDAAVQVAHAIGVSAATPQFDFYTAKDDMKTGSLGAEMMGSIEFDAPVLYRYAVISTDDLKSNGVSDEDAKRAIGEFVRTFITTLPGGRQNSFAAHSIPEYVEITISDAPVNLSQAFMKPSEGDIITEAVEKLVERRNEIEESYVPSIRRFVIASKKLREIAGDAETATLFDIAEKVTESI